MNGNNNVILNRPIPPKKKKTNCASGFIARIFFFDRIVSLIKKISKTET